MSDARAAQIAADEDFARSLQESEYFAARQMPRLAPPSRFEDGQNGSGGAPLSRAFAQAFAYDEYEPETDPFFDHAMPMRGRRVGRDTAPPQRSASASGSVSGDARRGARAPARSNADWELQRAGRTAFWNRPGRRVPPTAHEPEFNVRRGGDGAAHEPQRDMFADIQEMQRGMGNLHDSMLAGLMGGPPGMHQAVRPPSHVHTGRDTFGRAPNFGRSEVAAPYGLQPPLNYQSEQDMRRQRNRQSQSNRPQQGNQEGTSTEIFDAFESLFSGMLGIFPPEEPGVLRPGQQQNQGPHAQGPHGPGPHGPGHGRGPPHPFPGFALPSTNPFRGVPMLEQLLRSAHGAGGGDGNMSYEDWVRFIERVGDANRGCTDAEIATIPRETVHRPPEPAGGVDSLARMPPATASGSGSGAAGSSSSMPARPNPCDEDEKCPICLGEYEEGQEISRLPCSHIFCTPCISHWLKVSKECPLCKADIRDSRESR